MDKTRELSHRMRGGVGVLWYGLTMSAMLALSGC